jgi:predicted HTH transcriptional regulator
MIYFAVRLRKDARQRDICCAFFNGAHDKQCFPDFYKIHKNYLINVKNFINLTQVKLCCVTPENSITIKYY